ncbi:hypothetical protein DSO57_1020483 [Entomophthora muscae]|uniref:Uncharacterized protein n=1 Tax=Entomophthora muscae TaxID=34485 RepID=A0ACC2UCP6_9FUNG|nr:hypothetical protein DSO57_1020483 [Entomophthora muscae]
MSKIRSPKEGTCLDSRKRIGSGLVWNGMFQQTYGTALVGNDRLCISFVLLFKTRLLVVDLIMEFPLPVLKEIGKHLEIEAQGCLRLVNKLWQRAMSPLFFRRAVIDSPLTPHYLKLLIKHGKHVRLLVIDAQLNRDYTEQDVIANLSSFPNIDSLIFKVNVLEELLILQKLYAKLPRLRHLQLHWEADFMPFRSWMVFERIHSLCVVMRHGQNVFAFVQKISCPFLKKLTIVCDPSMMYLEQIRLVFPTLESFHVALSPAARTYSISVDIKDRCFLEISEHQTLRYRLITSFHPSYPNRACRITKSQKYDMDHLISQSHKVHLTIYNLCHPVYNILASIAFLDRIEFEFNWDFPLRLQQYQFSARWVGFTVIDGILPQHMEWLAQCFPNLTTLEINLAYTDFVWKGSFPNLTQLICENPTPATLAFLINTTPNCQTVDIYTPDYKFLQKEAFFEKFPHIRFCPRVPHCAILRDFNFY